MLNVGNYWIDVNITNSKGQRTIKRWYWYFISVYIS